MDARITEYIADAPPEQKAIMEAVRTLIHQRVPEVTEAFKWSRPVFSTDKDFAYLKRAKAYVTLGFFQYEKLDDRQNLLEGTGKNMRHIKLKTVEDVDGKMLGEWIETVAK